MNYHQDQLCNQISQILTLVIPADIFLRVVKAISGKSKSSIVVLLEPIDENVNCNKELEKLKALKEELVDEIAFSIYRRRVPDISFEIILPKTEPHN